MQRSITREVHVGSTVFGGSGGLALIAGPCVIESREHALRHAENWADPRLWQAGLHTLTVCGLAAVLTVLVLRHVIGAV